MSENESVPRYVHEQVIASRNRNREARLAAEAEVANLEADYDRRGERLWRLAGLTGYVPGESDNDATAEIVVADALAEVARLRETLATTRRERNHAFLLLRVARRICAMPDALLRAINGTTASESEGDIADDAAEVDGWLKDHALAPRQSASEAPRTRDGEQVVGCWNPAECSAAGACDGEQAL